MNKQISLIAVMIFSFSVFADPTTKKSATQIDFNKMIDESSTSDLQQQMAAKTDTKDDGQNVKVNANKKKSLDFVDVEIGLGEGRPLVDRRFNSVQPAKVASDKDFNVKLFRVDTP